ncbi:hypothetical protein B566_EDAN001349 [Ephemera danica]|nr:hypothetical protein B566_EDAN001349 [Ephemera danica]
MKAVSGVLLLVAMAAASDIYELGLTEVHTVKQPVPVPVPHPVPVSVPRPVPVYVAKPYPVPVPRPVEVPVPRAVKVEVPRPYYVHVPRAVPIVHHVHADAPLIYKRRSSILVAFLLLLQLCWCLRLERVMSRHKLASYKTFGHPALDHKHTKKDYHRHIPPYIMHKPQAVLRHPPVHFKSRPRAKPFRASKPDNDGTGSLSTGFYPILGFPYSHQLHYHAVYAQPYSYQTAQLGQAVGRIASSTALRNMRTLVSIYCVVALTVTMVVAHSTDMAAEKGYEIVPVAETPKAAPAAVTPEAKSAEFPGFDPSIFDGSFDPSLFSSSFDPSAFSGQFNAPLDTSLLDGKFGKPLDAPVPKFPQFIPSKPLLHSAPELDTSLLKFGKSLDLSALSYPPFTPSKPLYTIPAPTVTIHSKYPVPVPKPYPVPVDKPVPVVVPVRYPVHVDKPYPVHVDKPYPVHVDKPYPVHVDKPYPVHVDKPYPVHIYKHHPHITLIKERYHHY